MCGRHALLGSEALASRSDMWKTCSTTIWSSSFFPALSPPQLLGLILPFFYPKIQQRSLRFHEFAYKGREIKTFAIEGMAEPHSVFEVIHVKHQSSYSILQPHQEPNPTPITHTHTWWGGGSRTSHLNNSLLQFWTHGVNVVHCQLVAEVVQDFVKTNICMLAHVGEAK